MSAKAVWAVKAQKPSSHHPLARRELLLGSSKQSECNRDRLRTHRRILLRRSFERLVIEEHRVKKKDYILTGGSDPSNYAHALHAHTSTNYHLLNTIDGETGVLFTF